VGCSSKSCKTREEVRLAAGHRGFGHQQQFPRYPRSERANASSALANRCKPRRPRIALPTGTHLRLAAAACRLLQRLGRCTAVAGTERILASSYTINASGSRGVQNDLVLIMVVEVDQPTNLSLKRPSQTGGFEIAIATAGEEGSYSSAGQTSQVPGVDRQPGLPRGRRDGLEVGRRARELTRKFR
jgi:hypothetical protein